MSDLNERLAEVLAAHLKRNIKSCDCGWAEIGKAHYDHLAAVLAPVVKEAQADLVDALADELDATQNAHDIAEVAAYAPGETGRQSCIDNWEAIIEEPAEWLRTKATEHRGNDRDHLQELLYDAWDAGHDDGDTYGYQRYGYERGYVDTLDAPQNPYDRSNDE